MKYREVLQRLLLDDPIRMKALHFVRELNLSDAWIGAGFVRDAVWDHLHGYGKRSISGDVDVVWFDSEHCNSGYDSYLEDILSQRLPEFNWSVKNQARMHQRNGNTPYISVEHALHYWPETATAVATRLRYMSPIEIIAPYGLNDLFELRLRPTPTFEHEKFDVFKQRVTEKRWIERYPLLQLIIPA